MKRIYINEIEKYIGKQIKIAGFVQIIRDQGSIKFMVIRDITGIIQIVITKDQKDAIKVASDLALESVVEINGLAKKEKQAPGGVELLGEKISVLSFSYPELPIPVNEKGSEETTQPTRLDWRWLDLRKPKNILIFKAWTIMDQAFREYWLSKNYIEIHTPKLISTASESGAEVFEVKYFKRKAYLAQSPQFYKQMAMASGFEKVFEVGPVFRAEQSFTSRHATEFTGYDSEISYIESHKEIMEEQEKIIHYAIKKVKEKLGEEIFNTYGKEVIVPKIPFPRASMKDVKKILSDLNVASEKEGDLSPEEERRFSEYIKDKEGHEFVFITEYPFEVRPFYHMKDEKDDSLTKSFDLLWQGLEITTGAQREHRYDVLLKQAEEKGMKIETIQFYLNFFKYGCPPHGGYGMGPNRMVMKLLGLDNIREAMFLYRGVKRLEP